MAEIPLTINTSETTQTLLKLSDQLEVIQDQTEDINKGFKDSFGKASDSVDETTKAVMDNTKAQKSNEKSIDDLKKGVVDFQKKKKSAFKDDDVEEYGDEVDDAKKKTRELADETKDFGNQSEGVFSGLKEGIGDIGGDLQGLGGALSSGDGGGAIGGLNGILGKLGPIGIGVAAVTGAAVALGTAIVDIDQKFDKLRGTVHSLFDATEEEASRIVVNVEAIADTFDEDVNEVLLATNTLAKEFGISGEEASNLIASGFNSAANAQGDLIDSVKEFSAQVRASGGDAEDLFAILEKSNQEGIFSDKGIDVVKEFGLRIREQAQGTTDALSAAFGADFTNNLLQGVDSGAISSIDALKLVSEELGNLDENSKEVQTVIADVFGGAGEDAGFRFLTQLKDINSEEGFRNRQLSETEERQKATLEANQRLAAAQNKLSLAIGDSSEIGRIWIDIQTFFIELLVDIVEGVEAVIDAFSSWENFIDAAGSAIVSLFDPFSLLTDEVNRQVIGWDELTDEEKKNIGVKREATNAIREYGRESAVLVDTLNKQFEALAEGALTDEKRLELTEKLNQQYPEQIGNIDLLTASEEELLKVKQDIIRSEIEADIARKKAFATRQLEFEIEKRRAELERGVSDARRKILEDEIEFLDTQFRERIDLVEEEIKIQAGLQKRADEDTIEQAELTEEELAEIAREGAQERLKIQDEFNKAIQDILKRGAEAERNDQFVSEEERIRRNRDFQRQELAQLLDHAKDLNEALTGSRELDQEVIDAFNRADEKIITDAQDKILAIERAARLKARQEQLNEDKAILAAKQTRFNQELSLLAAQEAEEIALIEQGQQRRLETEAGFQRRIELEKLQTQEFFLQERIDLIDRENSLKINALNLELDALSDKQGAEVEILRAGLLEKKRLLEQDTATQKAQLDLQLQNTRNNILEIERTVPTLGEVFDEVQNRIAESLGLDADQLKAIVGAVQQVASEVFNTIQEGLGEQLKANDELLAKLDEREDAVKESLDREIEFAQAGYAANVEAKRDELAQIEQAQLDAAEQREKILKQQALLDEISQVSSLVTASANLYKSLSPLPFGVGIALATALTAGMFASFVATKAKARNVASLEKGGHGDSTGIIKGRRHSEGGEAWRDHIEVEDGEAWSVFSRRSTSKYGDLIREFTEAVNTDNVSRFMAKQGVSESMMRNRNKIKNEEISLQAMVISQDLRSSGDVLPEIKGMLEKRFRQPDRSFVQKDGSTYMVEVWPDGSKKKTKINIRG